MVENRCRLVLIAPRIAKVGELVRVLGDALRGGDVASVILPQYDLDDRAFQDLATAVVPVIQNSGAAALICGEDRIAVRTGADGVHVDGPAQALREAVDRHTPKLIVGGGNARDRHSALEVGEARPDYVFFGKLEGDIKPEPHQKNLALGEWWAQMVEIPCIVMGGMDPESALAVADTGAEFVALRQAVFSDPAQAAQVIAAVNALLDEKAPRFED